MMGGDEPRHQVSNFIGNAAHIGLKNGKSGCEFMAETSAALRIARVAEMPPSVLRGFSEWGAG